ncbi:MAG: hypothetical protein AAF447_15235 [Myxococcota bacterium]
MRRFIAVVFAAALMFPELSVRAQETAQEAAGERPPTDAELAAARARFGEGVALADAGDHEAALAAYREVLTVVDAPAVHYNVAHSLAELGRFAQADTQLQRLLASRDTDPETRALAAQQRQTLERLGGRLRIHVRGDAEGAVVRLDGWDVPAERRVSPLRVSAGEHALELVVDGAVQDRETLVIATGDRAEVVLRPLPEPEDVPVATAVATPEPGPAEEPAEAAPRWKDWRVWAIVGGVAAALALGIGIGVAAGGSDGGAATAGDLNPGVLTFGG